MTTLAEFRSRVLRFLGDADGVTYEDDLLIDAICQAIDAILPWVPKGSLATITGNGAYAYALPVDCYSVESVQNNTTGLILPRSILSPGQYRGAGISDTENDWIEYPNGFLTFSNALDSDDVLTLFYHAYWAKPNALVPAGVLEPPRYAEYGMVLYAAHYAILPSVVNIAEIRNWATRQDSGTPEHNPMEKTALYLLQLFIQEMNRLPKISKASK